MEIYSSQYSVLTEVLAQSGVDPAQVAAIGITNQRETTIVWDRETGRPVYNAIVWQCRRTAALCEELKADDELTSYIREHTGLLPDAYFSATKLKWVLDHVEGARERARRGELLFGTVDSWLIWKLTAGATFASDYCDASITQLLCEETLDWDDDLLRLFGVPRAFLPELKNADADYGRVSVEGLPGLPITGVIGDSAAALFGQRCFSKGDVKITYGTGSSILMNLGPTAVPPAPGTTTSVGWRMGARRGDLRLGGNGELHRRDRRMARQRPPAHRERQGVGRGGLRGPDSGDVYLVPAFVGLGAPYWDSDARGLLIGLTRATNRAHVARAALEGIAFQCAEVLEAMQRDAHVPLTELRVDGGASRNDLLMQFQADISGVPVIRPANTETTALGAAFLAGLACGVWRDLDELSSLWRVDRVFEPSMSADQKTSLMNQWSRAVGRARNWNQ